MYHTCVFFFPLPYRNPSSHDAIYIYTALTTWVERTALWLHSELRQKNSVYSENQKKKKENITHTKKEKEIQQHNKQQHLQQPCGSTMGSNPVAKGDLQFVRDRDELCSHDVSWKLVICPLPHWQVDGFLIRARINETIYFLYRYACCLWKANLRARLADSAVDPRQATFPRPFTVFPLTQCLHFSVVCC